MTIKEITAQSAIGSAVCAVTSNPPRVLGAGGQTVLAALTSGNALFVNSKKPEFAQSIPVKDILTLTVFGR